MACWFHGFLLKNFGTDSGWLCRGCDRLEIYVRSTTIFDDGSLTTAQ
jgi:hypothetical protein